MLNETTEREFYRVLSILKIHLQLSLTLTLTSEVDVEGLVEADGRFGQVRHQHLHTDRVPVSQSRISAQLNS